MNSNNEHTNRLKNATSPYLLQHAHNPVDWYEWGDEAWELAKKENKPVLISIGYSACHWCHVMAHECFEDNETAEMMNRWFVNIKVDREERPDVDMVYMDACQLITGRGGWPLNVICLPDQRPIHAGTYFPKESWQQVLLQIQSLYNSDFPKLLDFASEIEKGMAGMKLVEKPAESVFKRDVLPELYNTLSKQFDYENGGPNRAPKFPMPNNYEFLLNHYLISGDKNCLDFVHLTLLKMANGGIYDPIRGGFCRYSTDKYWFAPHFEKMLYDNAQLTSLYARAFAISDAPLYKEITEEILGFCMRELCMENGGYYSALDADSDGIEGRFYVFTDEELQACLTKEEYAFASLVFGCKPNGNWEHHFNILHKPLAPLQILEKTGLKSAEYFSLLSEVKQKLFEEQNKRNRPGLDNKIITSWNGLILEGLAKAAEFTSNKNYLKEAQRLAEWIWNHLQCDGKLWRIYSAGKASIPAFSEDYACLISGLIALFEADQNVDWLRKGEKLADIAVSEFYDSNKHTFHFTGKNNEQLIQQKADVSDDVISSSNSIFCIQLQKLGILLNRTDLIEKGKGLLNSVRKQVAQYPGWYSNWCGAVQIEAIGLLQVECTGPEAQKNHILLKKHLPSWAVSTYDIENSNLPLLDSKFKPNENQIFICLGNTCFEPVASAEQALEIIADVLGNVA